MCEEEEEREFVDLVLSDVHLGSTDSYADGQRTVFYFQQPASEHTQVHVDGDGDLDPPRKKAKSAGVAKKDSESLTIVHKGATPLKDVGFQVWRGALILADFLVHNQSKLFLTSAHCVEIGCGVGLCGLVLARVAPCIFLTDYSDEILDNCVGNISLNEHLFTHKGSAKARRLDWMDPATWPSTANISPESKYGWREEDAHDLQNVNLVIAADVIYDDELTDSLFNSLKVLLEGGRILLLALEKRLNFTIEDLDITAHAYNHFREFLISTDDPTIDWGSFSSIWGTNTTLSTSNSTTTSNTATETSKTDQQAITSKTNSKVESTITKPNASKETPNNTNNYNTTTNTSTTENTNHQTTNENKKEELVDTVPDDIIPTRPQFYARPIPIDFPQYFQYERVKELELWAIKLIPPFYELN